jgi:GT2 family glycosyltransferase
MTSVLIVTYNSEKHILRCLESVAQQTYTPLEIIVIDNASSDSSWQLVSDSSIPTIKVRNQQNTGFAAAQNQAMRLSHGEWLLILNPDLVLHPDFIKHLVEAGERDPSAATLCGKLYRWTPDEPQPLSRVLDSTGMYFTREMRHFDRGEEQKDEGQFDREEYVFGASGAAMLLRRSAMEDLSLEGQFFDEDFFAYREDADLAWRAQLFGWRCRYCPQAIGWHLRRVTSTRFAQLPHFINWHSVKNRFLMRKANISGGLYRRVWLATTFRDLMVIGYALLRDWRMLSALAFPFRHRERLLRKRRWVQAKRRVTDKELAPWFLGRTSLPSTTAPQKAAATVDTASAG